jgi:hypothetical protein
MLSVVLAFLVFGLPAAIACSYWAGTKVLEHNKPLGGVILIGATASVLTVLWEMRFDIGLISNLLGIEGLFMFDDLDTDKIYMTIYAALFLALFIARVRWKAQFGPARALNLALFFWLLSAIPSLVIGPGTFAN